MLPDLVKKNLANKEILDFGIVINQEGFKFHQNYCEIPISLVIAYSLAVANSGLANQIILAGFDGYSSEDPRRKEMDQILRTYIENSNALPLQSITPTPYEIPTRSIFGLDS
jgi:4-hydroxy 2-oxovalerate aldolase